MNLEARELTILAVYTSFDEMVGESGKVRLSSPKNILHQTTKEYNRYNDTKPKEKKLFNLLNLLSAGICLRLEMMSKCGFRMAQKSFDQIIILWRPP